MRTVCRPHSPAAFRYSPLVAALAMALAPQASRATDYLVTNSGDSSAGTLRQAIIDSNAACVPGDQIVFSASPGPGPFTVAPATPLPNLSCGGITIVGAGGYALDGSTVSASYTGCGLDAYFTYGSAVTVSQLEVFGFNTYAYGTSTGLCGNLNVTGSNIHDNYKGMNLDKNRGYVKRHLFQHHFVSSRRGGSTSPTAATP